MKLYAIYTQEAVALKDIFIGSLKDPWELHLVDWSEFVREVENWGTAEFIKLMRRKVEYIVQVIKKEMGNVIIWSDIDIQFFAPCTEAINKAIKDKDIVFSAEHWPKKEVNVGFFVLRCNLKTLAFYEEVLNTDFEAMQYYDQSAVNKLLKEKTDLVWDVLPYQFWAKSHGGAAPRDILLHHANTTFPCMRNGQKVSSLELKLEQFKEIREFIQSYPVWKWQLWGKWRFPAKACIYKILTMANFV